MVPSMDVVNAWNTAFDWGITTTALATAAEQGLMEVSRTSGSMKLIKTRPSLFIIHLFALLFSAVARRWRSIS